VCVPFGEGVLRGYHRCLWLYIPSTIAFGHTVPDIITARARRLKCEDPRARNREHRLPQRALKLQETARILLSQEYDVVDVSRVESTSSLVWTPAVSRISARLALWHLVIKRLRGGQVS
jgi:hypothetical protein